MEIWQMREIIREVYTTFTWQQKVKKKNASQTGDCSIHAIQKEKVNIGGRIYVRLYRNYYY